MTNSSSQASMQAVKILEVTECPQCYETYCVLINCRTLCPNCGYKISCHEGYEVLPEAKILIKATLT